MHTQKNHLAQETSPYLLQHANNPVDWYPWGEQALNKAQSEGKPILLSIGYSACHWCHVMAHESFEDEETAALMNHYFVNIKVDREERPDLDKIYQTTLQLLTGKPGGWPLTIFLTHDNQAPFFAGTYFPKHAGFGLPSFKELLKKIASYYSEHSDNVKTLANKIIQALHQLTNAHNKKNGELDTKLLQNVRDQLIQDVDRKNGGFGTAPKFPHPTNIEQLLHRKKDTEAINIAIFCLEKMAQGGIYDHIGGGFFRYSIDEAWMIPHFEKMLYDNAQLLPLYAAAHRINNNEQFKTTAQATGEWVIREMQADQGGYYSTINADSEGKEGKYYYWDRDDIRDLLTENEYTFCRQYFALDLPPNFAGHWHLYTSKNIDVIASELHITTKKAKKILKAIQKKLFAHRKKRVPPERDKKILTAWNGLMIKGMTIAGKYLQRDDFILSAQVSLDFIINQLWSKHRLLASYKDNKAQFMGYLDDYVFLLDGIIHYLQCHWSNRYIATAIEIAETLTRYFYDEKNGGFFFTAHDHESLIQRPKPLMDESIPAGNGIAAHTLLRLGHLVGEQRYLDIAESTLQMAWRAMYDMPMAHNSLLLALKEYFTPPTIVILRGNDNELSIWQKKLNHYYLPQHMCFAISNTVTDLPEALQHPARKKGVTAYICQGRKCHTIIHVIDEFANYLRKFSY